MSKFEGRSEPNELPFALTLHVRDHCLCMHVRRAARAIARRYDEALRPVGLTNGQFSLLMSLNRPTPPVMGEVAALLAMDSTTLTANLKPLQRRGLVQAVPDQGDRRSRRLALTAEGKRALTAAMPIWERTQVENEALVGRGAAEDLLAALRSLS
jgi:DNA-binding MarR family transcriptional regulator